VRGALTGYAFQSRGSLLNDETPALRTDGRSEPRGGSVIAGRYRIDRLIARGGMSTVYLAHQTKLNRPVALKLLSPPPSGDDVAAFEHRFRREAQTLAQLDHNNIVVLHDYGETEDGRFYLAMEYIEGPRLSDLLKDGPLPVQEALNLLIQVCAGLRYAHKRGVVHRDLKPSNLLVRRTEDEVDQIKIVDFGLVKLVESDQNITRAGLILGSPHCMAPEQVKGLQIDHRADIYAVGVLLFRTITGQYPFHGTNSAATMIAHLNQAIPTFYTVSPEVEVPPGLEELVRRCMAKHPADRFADMREVIDALTPLMDVPPEGLGIRTLTHSHSILPGVYRQRPPPPAWATPRAAIAALMFGTAALMSLAAIAVALVAVGGILQSRWARTPDPVAPTVVIAPPPVAPATAPTPGSGGVGSGGVGSGGVGEEPEAPPVGSAEDPAPPVTRPEPAVARPEPAVARGEPAVARPEPTRRPDPAPAAAPAPKPEPEVRSPTVQAPVQVPAGADVEVPEGYLGLPDDLIE
jgi:eukaryotic-like serine/threonine-protein kinase